MKLNTKPFEARRSLGRTGFKVTRLGIGDLADRKIALEECVDTLRRALDWGLNLVDTAPEYEQGYSEEIVGKALKGYREKVFVVDKVDHLTDPVLPQIEKSLERLEMDFTDAFVFHGVSTIKDWKLLLKPKGAFDQIERAIQEGKTRFRGISSHHPDVLAAAIQSERCDLLMFPLGAYVDSRYIHEILPKAKAKGIGTICFKTFGAGKLVGDTLGYNQPLQNRPRGKVSSGGKKNIVPQYPHLSPKECLFYTLTLDPDVALLGLSFPNEQDVAFTAAKKFRPLSQKQMQKIESRAVEAMKGKGDCWWNP